jgi:carbon storage regulator
MLIIARRKGERVVIGQDIEVVITDISRHTVKLGFSAPRSRTILRGEVVDSVEKANRAAAACSVDDAVSVVEKAVTG